MPQSLLTGQLKEKPTFRFVGFGVFIVHSSMVGGVPGLRPRSGGRPGKGNEAARHLLSAIGPKSHCFATKLVHILSSSVADPGC
jgi:hypothetical protein